MGLVRNGALLAGAALVMSLAWPAAPRADAISIVSREYKVGIGMPAVPAGHEAAFAAVRDRLTAHVPGLEFEAPRRGSVQFLDTGDCGLKNGSMLLRARLSPGKPPRLTLKIRNPDILAVNAMPVSIAGAGTADFEDDYGIGPAGRPVSDFSRSLSFTGAVPATLGQLAGHIDNLALVVGSPPDTPLMAGPMVSTTVYHSRPVKLAGDTQAVIEVSLWYLAEDGAPVAGDVSFTTGAPFSLALLRASDRLLLGLAEALGPLRGESAMKASAALPAACR